MYILGQGRSNYVDIKGASSYVITLPLNVNFVPSPIISILSKCSLPSDPQKFSPSKFPTIIIMVHTYV